MLEYRPNAGVLAGVTPKYTLSLPAERPLSYLRVEGSPHCSMTLARALLEHRATEFRRRIPLVLPGGEGRADIASILERYGVSPVYPVLDGHGEDEGPLDICWLDRVQILAVGRGLGVGFGEHDGAVASGGLKIFPTYAIDQSAPTNRADTTWQYWNKLKGIGLCQPVEVRVSLFNRITAEVGNMAWLVLIGLIGTAAALLHLQLPAIVASLAGAFVVLLALKAIRSIR